MHNASQPHRSSRPGIRQRAGSGLPALRVLALLVLLLWPAILAEPVAGGAATAEQSFEQSVIFHVQGNQALSTNQLKSAAAEDLELFTRHGRRTAVNDAAYLMQLAYRRAGYHFALVDYEIRESPAAIEAVFLVTEGPQVLLGQVTFTGNTLFTDSELATLVENIMGAETLGPAPFIEARLNDAVSRIRDLYLDEGYRDISINIDQVLFIPTAGEREQALEGPRRATVSIRINEGLRWLITGVELDREPPPAAAERVARALAEAEGDLLDRPYFTRRKLVLRSLLLEAFHETGYPEARVQIEDQPGDQPGEIILRAEAESGPMVIIEDIEISGNQRTSSNFIDRRLQFTPGTVYNDRHRRESFRELYGSGLFSRIDLDLVPADDQDEEIPAVDLPAPPEKIGPTVRRRLLVDVEEAASREFFLAGGWGSYEMLRLRAGFTDRNLFGHGRILRLESGGSMKGWDIKTGITDPWFLETTVTAEIPVYYRTREEPSFTRTEFGLGLLFSRDLTRSLKASLSYQIRRSDISSIRAAADTESLESGYGIASLKFQLTRDTRNDIFFPTAGHRIYGAVEKADKVLGSDLDFYRFNSGWRQFKAISPTLTLGLRADTGLIIPDRDQVNIPLGERFYSGGENSVRSFREGRLGPKDLNGRPVGGMGFNTLSIELRRRLGDNLGVSVFADYGNVSPNLSRAEEGEEAFISRSEVISATLSDYFSDFRPGLGAGLQYMLPVGPARLDIAFNPDRQDERHETTYAIHFSLGMAF